MAEISQLLMLFIVIFVRNGGLGDLYSTARGSRSWAHDFERNGFCHLQECLSDRVRDELKFERPRVKITDCPTLEQVSLCFQMRYALRDAIAFGPTM